MWAMPPRNSVHIPQNERKQTQKITFDSTHMTARAGRAGESTETERKWTAAWRGVGLNDECLLTAWGSVHRGVMVPQALHVCGARHFKMVNFMLFVIYIFIYIPL